MLTKFYCGNIKQILLRQEFSYNYYYCENTNRGVQANTNQNKHFYVHLCSL